MSHDHSFERSAKAVYWDEERDLAVVERACERYVQQSGGFGGPPTGGRGMGRSEEPCSAVKKVGYELESVVDSLETHPDDATSVVVRDERDATTDGSRHISSYEDGDVPEWVERVAELAEKRVESVDAEMMLTDLRGAQFSFPIATSETEYRVVFTRVDSWVDE